MVIDNTDFCVGNHCAADVGDSPPSVAVGIQHCILRAAIVVALQETKVVEVHILVEPVQGQPMLGATIRRVLHFNLRAAAAHIVHIGRDQQPFRDPTAVAAGKMAVHSIGLRVINRTVHNGAEIADGLTRAGNVLVDQAQRAEVASIGADMHLVVHRVASQQIHTVFRGAEYAVAKRTCISRDFQRPL